MWKKKVLKDVDSATPVTEIGDDPSDPESDSPAGDTLSDLIAMSRFSPLFRFPSDEIIKQLNQLEILPKCVIFDLDDTVWCGDVDCTSGPPFAPFISSSKADQNSQVQGTPTKPNPSNAGGSDVLGVDGIYDRTDIDRMGVNTSKKSKASKDSNKKSPQIHPSLELFKDVLAIFTWLESKKLDIHIAVASRTTQPRWADKALTILKTANGSTFSELIGASECYNTCKQTHLNAICRKLKIRLSEVVFYDNLYFNLSDVESMPITDPSTGRVNRQITAITQYTPRGLDWDNFVEGLVKYQEARQGLVQ